MPHISALLADRISAAVAAAFGPDLAGWDAQLRPATRPEFGHFQTNTPLRLAGVVHQSPSATGTRLLESLDVEDLCLPPELAGQGFVNLTLRPDVLAGLVTDLLAAPRLGVEPAVRPRRVVVDYSAPNVAKEMHVGHLRSTVIGDCLSRVLVHVGHDDVRQNHIGDWGTPFGMLIEALLDEQHDGADLDLAALARLYRRANTRFGTDPEFADRARLRVVALQSGDPSTLAVWRRVVDVSIAAFDQVYSRLGSALTDADLDSESSYNADLPAVVADLDRLGLLTLYDGALCAFLDGFTGRDGAPRPLVVRKSDGGYGYVATDLAAIRRRVDTMGAGRLVYVVGAPQSLHFEMVFALARAAGWLPEHVTVTHVAFGTILGEDGRPLRSRSGETVALTDLLDDAQARAAALVDGRGSVLTGAERDAVVRAVAQAAVTYADLSSGLGRDYVFSLDRMVAMDGATGPYLQYAHARLATLLGRAGESVPAVTSLDHPVEQRLALLLTGFPDVVASVAETLEPHRLCSYLYDVAAALSTFYEACPVLRADDDVRRSRLALCLATRRVLATGLGLLGIEALERM
jgi:arginyl-tRNA synthetase